MALKVKYIIPEDGDTIDHPNIFRLRSSDDSSVTLLTLKQQFPIPGAYQFRFLSKIASMNVWRDLTYDEDCIPSTGGSVTIKANRLQFIPQQKQEQQEQHISFSSTDQANSPLKPKALPARAPSDRLISFDDGEIGTKASPKVSRGETDLLGFDQLHAAKPSSSSSPDLFGLQSVPLAQPTSTGLQSTSQPIMRPPSFQQSIPPINQQHQYGNSGAYPYGRPGNVDAFSGLTNLKK